MTLLSGCQSSSFQHDKHDGNVVANQEGKEDCSQNDVGHLDWNVKELTKLQITAPGVSDSDQDNLDDLMVLRRHDDHGMSHASICLR